MKNTKEAKNTKKEKACNKREKIELDITFDVGSFSTETEKRIGKIIPLSEDDAKKKKKMFTDAKASILEKRTRIGQIVIGRHQGDLCMIIGDHFFWEYTDIVRLNEEIIMGVRKTPRGFVKEFMRYDGYSEMPKSKNDIYVDWRVEAMNNMEGLVNILCSSQWYGTDYRKGGFYVRCEQNPSIEDCVNVFIGLDACCGYKTSSDREYVGVYDRNNGNWVLPATFSKVRVKDKFISGTNEVRYGIASFMSHEQLYYLNGTLAKCLIETGYHHIEPINENVMLVMVTDSHCNRKYIEYRRTTEECVDVYGEADDLVLWTKHTEYTDLVYLDNDAVELMRPDKTTVTAHRATFEEDTAEKEETEETEDTED